MELVNDLEQYQSILRGIKEQHGRPITNCFLLPEDLEVMIRRRRLFWQLTEAGLLLLYEEAFFFQMYFFIIGGVRVSFTSLKKPVLTNLVYREPMQNSSVSRLAGIWIENGFQHYKTNRRMIKEKNGESAQIDDSLSIDQNAYRVILAGLDQVDDLIQLWTQTLDIFSNAIPMRDDLNDLVARGLVLCVLDKYDRLAAALEFVPKGRECVIQHVAVEPQHRNRNLAKMLLQRCYQVSDNSDRFLLWVAEDNLPAINLYQKQEFNFDLLVSHQLIYK